MAAAPACSSRAQTPRFRMTTDHGGDATSPPVQSNVRNVPRDQVPRCAFPGSHVTIARCFGRGGPDGCSQQRSAAVHREVKNGAGRTGRHGPGLTRLGLARLGRRKGWAGWGLTAAARRESPGEAKGSRLGRKACCVVEWRCHARASGRPAARSFSDDADNGRVGDRRIFVFLQWHI